MYADTGMLVVAVRLAQHMNVFDWDTPLISRFISLMVVAEG